MNEQEHTPGPWHGHLGTGPGEDGVARLMNVDDDILADLRQHSTANAPANLRRIVACVNAHDELLEALKKALPALDSHILPAHDQAARDWHAQLLQQVYQAIAKAELRQ